MEGGGRGEGRMRMRTAMQRLGCIWVRGCRCHVRDASICVCILLFCAAHGVLVSMDGEKDDAAQATVAAARSRKDRTEQPTARLATTFPFPSLPQPPIRRVRKTALPQEIPASHPQSQATPADASWPLELVVHHSADALSSSRHTAPAQPVIPSHRCHHSQRQWSQHLHRSGLPGLTAPFD